MGWESRVAQELNKALSILLVSWHNVITIWGWKQVLPAVEQTPGQAHGGRPPLLHAAASAWLPHRLRSPWVRDFSLVPGHGENASTM